MHVSFQIIGFLMSLAGIAVGTYFPADEKLMVQHKIIGIVVNVVAGLQVSKSTPLDVWASFYMLIVYAIPALPRPATVARGMATVGPFISCCHL